ncbi:hypothetical protein LTR37_001005 [Vermiconidia calcicola]|uniref:Uncharacterized protein n=1 Tax=Vermiconidia calcicola TaxID=1690605 RepID=A0ACC3NWX2_9PEZI|nr:hypothetical protein LTR37_001005 [Vermiconidia calcicola]
MAAPQWIQISQAEAADMFREAVGALTLQIAQAGTTQLIAQEIADSLDLDPEQTAMVGSLPHTQLAALGSFIFVYPYERYKKIARRYPDRHLDPSAAFGLNAYSSRRDFSRDYPHAVIHTWDFNNVVDRPSWFADCVRNSLAHAQTRYVTQAGNSMVNIYNTRDGDTPNFDIMMRPHDLWKLMRTGLEMFVQTVVAPPAPGQPSSYPPIDLLVRAWAAQG